MQLRNTACLLLLFVSLTAGCSNVGGFELGIPLAEQRVDGNPLGGLLGSAFEVPIPLNVDLAAETAARDTGPAQHVRLASLTLSITSTAEPSGDTDDFGFIDSAQIFVESRQRDSSLPRVQIAHLDAVPDGARELSFVTDESVDLLPYIDEGARLTSDASGTVPPDDVTFDGQATLSIEVL